jgi:hypothetical protein
MRTDLVCDALDMAARNYELAESCIFHSDYAEVCVMPKVGGIPFAGRAA